MRERESGDLGGGKIVFESIFSDAMKNMQVSVRVRECVRATERQNAQ